MLSKISLTALLLLSLTSPAWGETNFSTQPDVLKLRSEISLLREQVMRTQLERSELETRILELEISTKALYNRIEVLTGVELQAGD